MPKRAEESSTLRLALICLSPPPALHEGEPTEFGLQDRRGGLDPGETDADGVVRYRFDAQVASTGTDGADMPRLTGRFVHGTARDPFLYLGWRRVATDGWIRRLKISLRGITDAQVRAAGGAPDVWLEGRVSGEGAARVPLLGDGWELRGNGKG